MPRLPCPEAAAALGRVQKLEVRPVAGKLDGYGCDYALLSEPKDL